jgi:hypothetical protein
LSQSESAGSLGTHSMPKLTRPQKPASRPSAVASQAKLFWTDPCFEGRVVLLLGHSVCRSGHHEVDRTTLDTITLHQVPAGPLCGGIVLDMWISVSDSGPARPSPGPYNARRTEAVARRGHGLARSSTSNRLDGSATARTARVTFPKRGGTSSSAEFHPDSFDSEADRPPAAQIVPAAG